MSAIWKRTILRAPALVRFLPIYLREMTLSNLRVAVDAFRKNPHFTPGFVEVSVQGYDPIQQWEAACLISMTPGTLAVDLNDMSGVLLVHALYMTNEDQTRSELETLIQQALGKPQS